MRRELDWDPKSLRERPDSCTIDELLQEIGAKVVNFEGVSSIRGQEFQDVLIEMSSKRWDMFARNRRAAGAKTWEAIMPIHTFLTRATESATIVEIS
jgi:hypothetical protein